MQFGGLPRLALLPGDTCIKHVVMESPAKNHGRMFCTRKGVTLDDCKCVPKCVFLREYTKDVWD
jgi:hypothetical protein